MSSGSSVGLFCLPHSTDFDEGVIRAGHLHKPVDIICCRANIAGINLVALSVENGGDRVKPGFGDSEAGGQLGGRSGFRFR